MQIAIDGPAGVGKSTVAQELARRLDILYLDTGAMYRAVTLACLEAGVPATSNSTLVELLENIELSFFNHGQGICLGDRDVSLDIRSQRVSEAVSAYAALPYVRAELTKRQQAIAQSQSVVMDGRDIGTVVLPNADFKFFLDASPGVRAQRRAEQLRQQGESANERLLAQQMAERDHQDRHRTHAPLRQAEDAIAIQTDAIGVKDVVAIILQRIHQ